MHAASEEPQPSTPPAPKRNRRRVVPRSRTGRGLLLLLILLLLAAITTQVVLWTTVPRDLVLAQLQKQLGLRVEAASLTTGWLGDTHLRDVTISLPLAEESLLRVPRMRVKHNSLFGLLWTRAVTLDAIELDQPHLVVRQDPSGRWNLQQVAGLIARTGGKEAASGQQQPSASGRTSRPKLPSVRVTDATLEIVDRGGKSTTVAPVNVTGEPQDQLTWKYDVTAGPIGGSAPAGAAQLQLVGRVAVGGPWEHEVRVYAANVQRWAQPWAGDGAPVVSMKGNWRGQLQGSGRVAGRLLVERLDVADVYAAGAMRVGAEDGGAVVFRPEDVLVHTAQKAAPELRLTAGRLMLDAGANAVAAEGLSVLTSGGVARLDGRYDRSAGSVDVKAAWSDFAVPGQRITHSGTLTASLRQPFPGQPVVQAHWTSTGNMPGSTWDADLNLSGAGSSWSNVDWDFRAPRLTFTGRQPIKLDGLTASVQTRGSVVAITNLHGPGEVTATGKGQYNLASKDWNLRLDLGNLPRPVEFGRQGPVAITLNANGTAGRIEFKDPGISLRGTEAELRVDGTYAFHVPKPVDVNVNVNHVPPRVASTDTPPLFGYLRGEGHVTGTIWPLELGITGKLTGRGVRFGEREIGDIEAELTGDANEERAALQTNRLELLGGRWQLHALFPERGMLGMSLTVENLPLANLGGVLKRPDLEGTVDEARWAISVPRLEADAVKATGDIKGRGLKLGKFAADTFAATAVLADGSLRADPIRLRKGAGEATATAEMDIREFRRFETSLALSAWPFEPTPGTRAELWGGTPGLRVSLRGATRAEGIRRGVFQLESHAEKLWITGPLDLRAALTLKDQPCGDVNLLADMRGRVLDLRSLSYDGLDGTVQGQGVFDFDRPMEARGSVLFEDFDASRIPDFYPENKTLVGLVGRYSGRADIAPAPTPATGAKPLEPLRIRADVKNRGGRYRSVPIGPIRISAFTNLDRLVIQDSITNPTTIDLAGGMVRVWGRVSALEPGEELNPQTNTGTLLLSQVQVSYQALDLDQIVHAFSPDSPRVEGKLSGSFEALAGTRPQRHANQPRTGQGLVEKVVRRITADGRVEITASDLGNVDFVAFLYNALNVDSGPQQPEGKGNLTFHLEDGLLTLNRLRYFNRGVEVRGIADIDEVWRLPDSPIRGTAVGTARPFKDVKLPFLSSYSLDTIVTALQTDLTTVGLSGTVRNRQLNPLAFSDLGEGMRTFILGDFQQERSTARRRGQ
jgi:hypothetical protein